jgi:hypothetical protein
MGKHILSLDIRDTLNQGILLIDDTSTYDSLLPVTCPNLQITPPGYSVPASIDPLVSGFRLILNSCSLGLTAAGGCSTALPGLEDGLWRIRYSVSPNDKVFVEYYYMRTVKAMNRYYKLLCGLRLKCCLPDQETIYLLQQLDIIRNYILSAKVTTEECGHDVQDGINQLRYANALMDKMSTRKPYC